jgi:hypothetical protein
VVEYMMAFDTDLAPVVGQQVTLHAGNAASAGPRIDLLVQRAQAAFISKELGGATRECELTARLVEAGALKGYLFDPVAKSFAGNDGSRRSDAELRALAATEGQEITYTCLPPGSGVTLGQNPTIVVVAEGQTPPPVPGANVDSSDSNEDQGGGAISWAWLVALWACVLLALAIARARTVAPSPSNRKRLSRQ